MNIGLFITNKTHASFRRKQFCVLKMADNLEAAGEAEIELADNLNNDIAVCYRKADFTVNHPLQNTWVLWFDNPSSGRRPGGQHDWKDSLKEVYAISTIEDFWGVYNNVQTAEQIVTGCTFHLFKKGIEPCWEDKENALGGKWVIDLKNIPKSQGGTMPLNDMWLGMMMLVIGEQLSADSEEITGIVVAKRKAGNKLAIWTKHHDRENIVKRIGVKFKQICEIPETVEIEYQVHDDAIKSGVSFKNSSRYTC